MCVRQETSAVESKLHTDEGDVDKKMMLLPGNNGYSDDGGLVVEVTQFSSSIIQSGCSRNGMQDV